MTRLHTDQVEVRTQADQPHQFLWRGRLYLVAEVLGHWSESGEWWRAAAVQALTSGGHGSGAAGAQDPEQDDGDVPEIDDGSREWWRVEAGTGRTAPTGVYDLSFDWSQGAWALARVLD